MSINPEEEINKRAKNVSDEDIGKTARQEKNAERMAKGDDILRQYWSDIKATFSLLRDWCAGRYKRVQYRMIASLTAALVYMLSPFDIVPDFIPFVGLLEDALVLAAVFTMARADLDAYNFWSARGGNAQA